MNPLWLARNITTAWRSSPRWRDFTLRMLWLYSAKLGLGGREWIIDFRYPAPIGDMRLAVRTNRGADAFIHSEVFEHQYYRLPLVSAPRTILDLGANIGLAAIYFARMFPDAALACVEPVSGNLRLLRRNLALNAVGGTVIAAAVDARDGTVPIELDARDYGHRVATATSPAAEHEDVTAVSVPTLCRRLGWDRIGLLKVDIEGHEHVLLREDCDWLECVDAICIECHDDFGEADLRALAARYGFADPRRLPGIWFMALPTG